MSRFRGIIDEAWISKLSQSINLNNSLSLPFSVSTLAYQELQDVQEKLSEEAVLREKAEDFAAKVRVKTHHTYTE